MWLLKKPREKALELEVQASTETQLYKIPSDSGDRREDLGQHQHGTTPAVQAALPCLSELGPTPPLTLTSHWLNISSASPHGGPPRMLGRGDHRRELVRWI
jgi:hypothetical protein